MARREIVKTGTYGMVRRGAIIKPTTVAKLVQPTPPANTVRLNTGEYVPTSEFNTLTRAEQLYLKKFGVDAFNREQARVAGKKIKAHEQAVAFVSRETKQQEQWYKENIVEVGPDKEPVMRSMFNRLPLSQQKLLQKLGVTQYNENVLVEAQAKLETPTTLVAQQLLVEVETAKGKVTMPMGEWEAKSAINQYELVLGRSPTLTEWQGYRLMEAGIDLPWWKEMIPGAAGIIGTVASLIPGEIEEERYNRVKSLASKEWHKAYPELKGVGVGSAVLTQLGFPAAKAMYPQITVKDVSGIEWAVTGLSVALWSSGAWMPKVIAGLKSLYKIKLTTKAPVIKFRSPVQTVNLGIAGTKVKLKFPVKVSWGAGLQRAGLSSQVEKLAFNAGSAAQKLKVVTNVAKGYKGATYPAKIASPLKKAQINSLTADTKFIQSLSKLRLTSRQIHLLEKATGYKGLLKSIRNVTKATKALDAAWDTASKTAKMYGMGSRPYMKALDGVTKARTALGRAIDKLDDVLKPRYTESLRAGWDKVINSAKREVSKATEAYNRAASEIKSPGVSASVKARIMERVRADLKVARGRLDELVIARDAGQYPPSVTGYKMTWTGKQGELFPEGPALGGFGKGGTMTREFYEQQYQSMIKGWHKPQLWDSPEGWILPKEKVPTTRAGVTVPKGKVPTTRAGVTVPKGKVPTTWAGETVPTRVATLQARPATLQASMVGLKEYTVPTLSKLKLSATYAGPLAAQSKVVGYPVFSAENAFAGLAPVALRIESIMPQIVPATLDEIITGLGVTTKQLPKIKRLVGTTPEVIAIATSIPEVIGISGAEVINLSKVAYDATVKAISQDITGTKLELVVREAVEEELKESLKAKTITATTTQIKTTTVNIVKTTIDMVTRIHIGIGLPLITDSTGKERPMTKEELKGSVAWRQGFIYKLIYPPYGEKNILHNRKPFPGVKTASGAQSAYKTVTKLGIKLPESIKRDMGIMDIEIKTPRKGKGQPEIAFKSDVRLETWHIRGKRSKKRRFTNKKRTDRRERRLQATVSVGR